MSLDLERLRRDVDALGLSRKTEDVARGKASGAMAIVRTHLAEIERLRDKGATWTDIAAALAGQGTRRRDGAPITGRRLTGPDAPLTEIPMSEYRTAEQIRREGLADLYDQLKGKKP